MYWQVRVQYNGPGDYLAVHTLVATFQPRTIRIEAGNISPAFPTPSTNTGKAVGEIKVLYLGKCEGEASGKYIQRLGKFAPDKA